MAGKKTLGVKLVTSPKGQKYRVELVREGNGDHTVAISELLGDGATVQQYWQHLSDDSAGTDPEAAKKSLELTAKGILDTGEPNFVQAPSTQAATAAAPEGKKEVAKAVTAAKAVKDYRLILAYAAGAVAAAAGIYALLKWKDKEVPTARKNLALILAIGATVAAVKLYDAVADEKKAKASTA